MTEFVFPPPERFISELELGEDQYESSIPKHGPFREAAPVNLLDFYGALTHRDQRPCHSCVAHAVVTMLESIALRNGRGEVRHDPNWFHRCIAGRECDDTFGVTEMLTLLHQREIPLGDPAPDLDICVVGEGINVPPLYQVRKETAFKNALDLGFAVAATLWVDETLVSYQSGIYAITGERLGQHAVAVIGYDDNERTWLCRNSFGEGWGEDGNFKVRYNTLGLAGKAPGYCGFDEAFDGEPWHPPSQDSYV